MTPKLRNFLVATGLFLIATFACCGSLMFPLSRAEICTGTGSVIYNFSNVCNSGGYWFQFIILILVMTTSVIVIPQEELSVRARLILSGILVVCFILALLVLQIGLDSTPHIPPGTNLG